MHDKNNTLFHAGILRHNLSIISDYVKIGLSEPHFTHIVSPTNSKEIVALRLTSVANRPSKHEDPPHYDHYASNAVGKFVSALESKVRFYMNRVHQRL